MKQLRKKNPFMFFMLILFGVLDLAFAGGLILLPDAVFVQTQNTIVGTIGKMVLGQLLLFKGIAILLISLRARKVRTLRAVIAIGLVVWAILALTALIGMLKGTGTSWFGFCLCFFMALARGGKLYYMPREA